MKSAMLRALVFALVLLPQLTFAQQPVDPALIQQLRTDLEHAMANSNLTDAQKQKIQDDLSKLRQARQDQNRRAGRSALMDLRSQIQHANFKKEDQQKVQADFQQLRAARGR